MTQEEGDRERKVRLLYPEWPPEAILRWRRNRAVDQGELTRARWLWGRKPKEFFLPLFWRGIVLAVVPLALLIVAAVWAPSDTQEVLSGVAAGLQLVWCAGTAIEMYRQDRWRSDYSRAIARLFTHQD